MHHRAGGAGARAVNQRAASSTAVSETPATVEGPSALDAPNHPSLPEPLIDTADLVSGGPPPDGIPAIDDPRFDPASEVGWLEDDDPVLSLTVNGESRAYPLRVMAWHEIVNDTVDGVPVAVTYCPLCNSGVAFKRHVDGRLLDFGTSGLLYGNNLVMYDRQTESLWPQLTGQASVGVLTGAQLEAIPMGIVGWEQFRETHLDAMVLTSDTGFIRDYHLNPYAWYDDDPDGDLLIDPPGGIDSRLPVKERVVGITIGRKSVAIRRSLITGERVVPVTVGGRDLVVWHDPGQASALGAERIPDGQEVGSVGVFQPMLDGRYLTFDVRDGRLVDEQTGSTWNVLGRATAGKLKGSNLRAAVHLDTFWFAWIGFHPRTRVME